MYWDDLPEDLQRVIEEAQVVIYKIMPGTPTDVKFKHLQANQHRRPDS